MSLLTSVQGWRFPVDQSLWKDYKSLRLRNVKISPRAKGEVLEKIHADIPILYKKYQGFFFSGPGLIIGPDGAGEVLSIDDDVTEWSQGNRNECPSTVLGAGAPGFFVQYRAFPARALVCIPSHLPYEDATTLPCVAVTTWKPLFETPFNRLIGPHSIVLAQGSGGASMFAAQFGKVAGARVIATTSSAEKYAKYKKTAGVDNIINYLETPK